MSSEKLECDLSQRNPDIEIAQLKFELTLVEYYDDQDRIKKLSNILTENKMAPYYEIVCEELNWSMDQKLLEEMEEENEKVLKSIDEEIDYAEHNLSTVEVKNAFLSKANYLSKIGDKDKATKTLAQAFDRTIALGCKLENIFHCIRIGLFFKDLDLIGRNLQRAESLIAQGADWHSRNCYRMCKALYSLAIRDFKTSTVLLVDAISTFVCTELISMDSFVRYTIISGMLTLDRGEVKKHLIDNADIQQALHNDEALRDYLLSLHRCDYQMFFRRLADMEVIIKRDMLLHPHYRYYVKEMKVKAYDQLLSSYKSVGIAYMAEQFGVSGDFVENEVGRLIAAGRLEYKIDKANASIVTAPRDNKTDVFRAVVKHGDLLLTRIQKLSRVINI